MQSSSDNAKLNLKLLLALPIATYICSYLYLVHYHGRLFIFTTIVHEGGKLTLLGTMFYASHFLGHLPVHTVLAFLFTGTYLTLTGTPITAYSRIEKATLLISLVLFLFFSLVLSLAVFGYEDTFAFMAQVKQSETVYTEGGSWNLHLPSTEMLFLLMPGYIYIVRKIFHKGVRPNAGGLPYILVGVFLIFSCTFLFNKGSFEAFVLGWRDPRYLAHSVRELLTFPVTYFPIPLYFFLSRERPAEPFEKAASNRTFQRVIIFLAILFLLGFLYQSFLPLTRGIGNLSQRPAFAKGASLGIPYLLASHYFEHFLDSIYFTLVCVILNSVIEHKTRLESSH
jgi:hypothetical protein